MFKGSSQDGTNKLFSETEINQWTKNIHETIHPDIELIFQTDFFNALDRREFNKDEISKFAQEYFLASSKFPKLLSLACANMPTDELRLPFVRNLWDEHGQGISANSHRALLLKFLDYFNVGYQENLNGPAERYFLAMEDLCKKSNVCMTLGMFGPGCESFTPREYHLLVQGMKKILPISNADLSFFFDHIDHDNEHDQWLNECFRLAIRSAQDVQDIIQGARSAISIECQFWTEMYMHCREQNK